MIFFRLAGVCLGSDPPSFRTVHQTGCAVETWVSVSDNQCLFFLSFSHHKIRNHMEVECALSTPPSA